MEKISLEDLQKFSNAALTKRMDQLLEETRSERNPFYPGSMDPAPFVSPFFQTVTVLQLEESIQRKAIWMTFDFILQIEYVFTSYGSQNSIMAQQNFDNVGWTSPSLYTAYMYHEQAGIVGVRIALERLMDLVYFCSNTRDLRSGDSKFEKYREWLFSLPVESNWFYLIPFLPWMRKHDEKFRTAEVHTGSKLKKYILAMNDMPNEIKNDALSLLNILMNLWRQIVLLLDGKRPQGAGGTSPLMSLEWLAPYNRVDINALTSIREKVREELRVKE